MVRALSRHVGDPDAVLQHRDAVAGLASNDWLTDTSTVGHNIDTRLVSQSFTQSVTNLLPQLISRQNSNWMNRICDGLI